jgi:hypothetical protein
MIVGYRAATKLQHFRDTTELNKPRYFRTLLEGFPLDQEIHYPHENRITYSKQEIEEALSKIRHFNEFIGSLNLH